MNRRLFFLAISFLLLMQSNSFAQSQEVPKFEIAGEFTSLGRDAFSGERTEAGVGGRFTFNLNRNIALEAAGYLFPRRCFDCFENGHMAQAVGGIKIGKRFDSWGIFAKARPGLVTFSEAQFSALPAGPGVGGAFPLVIQQNRTTSFATDVGGVIEFYPSPRIVTRFDVGDTMVFFRRRIDNVPFFDPTTNGLNVVPVPRPARTAHNFQFIASVGFRF